VQTLLPPDQVRPFLIDAPALEPEPPVHKPTVPAHGCAGAASAPQSASPVPAGAVCCGSVRPDGRYGAWIPGIDPAEHTRLSVVAPGSEFSLSKLLEHRFVQLCVSQKPLEAGVFLLQRVRCLASVPFIPP